MVQMFKGSSAIKDKCQKRIKRRVVVRKIQVHKYLSMHWPEE